jgi:hypothetical protein
MRDLAQVKWRAGWNAVEHTRVRQPQMDTSRFTDQGDLARVKRDAAERAGGR